MQSYTTKYVIIEKISLLKILLFPKLFNANYIFIVKILKRKNVIIYNNEVLYFIVQQYMSVWCVWSLKRHQLKLLYIKCLDILWCILYVKYIFCTGDIFPICNHKSCYLIYTQINVFNNDKFILMQWYLKND